MLINKMIALPFKQKVELIYLVKLKMDDLPCLLENDLVTMIIGVMTCLPCYIKMNMHSKKDVAVKVTINP